MFTGKGFGAEKETVPAKEYPPLSKEEVEQWMGHIPVYAVTNDKGSGHAIQLPNNNKKTVFYFFLSSVMAEAFLKQLPNPEEDLTVSGLFLGKIWYEFELLQESTDDTTTEYRLVPDPRDLMTAQTLLEIAKGNQATQQLKVKPYNAIPLFGVNSMPLQNKPQKVKDFLNQMVSSHYLFFSSRNMLDVLDGMKQDGDTEESPEEDDLIFLHQVMAEMTLTSSSKDYRNMVLVPPAPILEGTVNDKVLAEQLDNPDSFVSQKFLLPLLKEWYGWRYLK